jgi:hypothetical protein
MTGGRKIEEAFMVHTRKLPVLEHYPRSVQRENVEPADSQPALCMSAG